MGKVKFKFGTLEQYQSIETKDNDTLYFITDKPAIYKGEKNISRDINKVTVTHDSLDDTYIDTVRLVLGDKEKSFKVVSLSAFEKLNTTLNALNISLEKHPEQVGSSNILGHTRLFDSADSSKDSTRGYSATPKAVANALSEAKKYADDKVSELGSILRPKGTLGDSVTDTISELPSDYSIGDVYYVNTPGTYAGHVCERGDMIIAVDNSGSVKDNWKVFQANLENTISATENFTDGCLIISSGIKGLKTISNGIQGQIIKMGAAGPEWGNEINTTYGFTSGTDGTFKVTSTVNGGTTEKTISVGYPEWETI